MLCASSISASEDAVNGSSGARSMIRIYDECTKANDGFVPCLKKKAITFLDRISNVDSISLGDGMRVVRGQDAPLGPSLTENELEASLPRGIDDRDATLTTLLIERVARFFSRRSLQVDFPRISSEELGRGLEEGRGKMKKMMGMMMMGIAMKMVGMIPVAIAALYLLAGKALIVSKIALLLAGIIGLKKLLAGRGGGSQSASVSSYSAGSGGWSSGGGHGGGGRWDRRSLDAAHDLAYKGYTKH